MMPSECGLDSGIVWIFALRMIPDLPGARVPGLTFGLAPSDSDVSFLSMLEKCADTTGIDIVLLTGVVTSAAESRFSGDEGIGGVVVFDLP